MRSNDDTFASACTRNGGIILSDDVCCFDMTESGCKYDVIRPSSSILKIDALCHKIRTPLLIVYTCAVIVFFLLFFFWNYWWQWINFCFYFGFITLLVYSASRIHRVIIAIPIAFVITIIPFGIRYLWTGYDLAMGIVYHLFSGFAIFLLFHLITPSENVIITWGKAMIAAFAYECIEAIFFYGVSRIVPIWDLNWNVWIGVRDLIDNCIGSLIAILVLRSFKNNSNEEKNQ